MMTAHAQDYGPFSHGPVVYASQYNQFKIGLAEAYNSAGEDAVTMAVWEMMGGPTILRSATGEIVSASARVTPMLWNRGLNAMRSESLISRLYTLCGYSRANRRQPIPYPWFEAVTIRDATATYGQRRGDLLLERIQNNKGTLE